MDIKKQLNEAMKDAMRSGDTVRKTTVRMALAAIKQVEVDKRTELDDLAVIALLQKEIKNRKEAIEEAKKAGREDLIGDNEAEIAVLEAFLPEAMSADELREIVTAAIAETGVSTPAAPPPSRVVTSIPTSRRMHAAKRWRPASSRSTI